MKRFFCILLIFLVCVCVFAACEEEEQPPIDYTTYLSFSLLEDDTYSVSMKRDAEATEIVIPDTYEGKPVTQIAKKGFLAGNELQSVAIPPSITSVGSEAFKNCESLTSVYITDLAAWCNVDFEDPTANPLYVAGNLYVGADNVLDIGVKIPTTVNTIKSYAFTNCVFRFLEIPENVTSIGDGAFYGCRWMLSPHFSANLESIGAEAFAFCESITSVTLAQESRLKSIGNGAFKECDILRTFEMPSGVESIGNDAFFRCERLSSIEIPGGVKTVGDRAFRRCYALEEVSFSEGLTHVGVEAFDLCTSLREVKLPESVVSIGERAFSDCENLTAVSIPSGVEYIGFLAFEYCDKLDYTTSEGGKYLGNSENPYLFLCLVDKTCVEFSISEQTVFIDGTAFDECTALTRITIPENVIRIGEHAFGGCRALTEVSFAENTKLTEIGSCAFNGCTALKSIKIPQSVTRIGREAFAFCDQLAEVTFEAADGWWYDSFEEASSGITLSAQDLRVSATAATYLKKTYLVFYWSRTAT
jgi:hypothetical protein